MNRIPCLFSFLPEKKKSEKVRLSVIGVHVYMRVNIHMHEGTKR